MALLEGIFDNKEEEKEDEERPTKQNSPLWFVALFILLISQMVYMSRVFPELQDVKNELTKNQLEIKGLEILLLQKTSDRYRREEAEIDRKSLESKIEELQRRIARLEEKIKEGVGCQQ